HTRFSRDWSSDVCSSDLEEQVGEIPVTVYKEGTAISKVEMTQPLPVFGSFFQKPGLVADLLSLSPKDLDQRFPIQSVSSGVPFRSEERRVGKEWRSGW